MAEIAPFPWRVMPYVDGIDIVDANGVLVARLADRRLDAQGMPPANARVIAAAPQTAMENQRLREVNAELLAACRIAVKRIAGLIPFNAHIKDEELRQAWESVGDEAQSDIDVIKAAMAKAEGRTP